MTKALIWRGNAISPYRVIAEVSFNTEFAARLFGFMSCQEDQSRYWVTEKVPA